MTNDYFYMNKDKVVVPSKGRHTIYDFKVEPNETVDFNVVVTSDQKGINNSLWLYLYKDGQRVVASVDDGETRNDDNASLSLMYKGKVGEEGGKFELKAEGSTANRIIPPTQMQIGYKTYGPGHMLSVL